MPGEGAVPLLGEQVPCGGGPAGERGRGRAHSGGAAGEAAQAAGEREEQQLKRVGQRPLVDSATMMGDKGFKQNQGGTPPPL